jgi:hypothetical protein
MMHTHVHVCRHLHPHAQGSKNTQEQSQVPRREIEEDERQAPPPPPPRNCHRAGGLLMAPICDHLAARATDTRAAWLRGHIKWGARDPEAAILAYDLITRWTLSHPLKNRKST